MASATAKAALFDALASVAQALGSGRRAEIVDVLAQGERSVDELASEISQSVANTSQHLQVLARAGLVRSPASIVDGNPGRIEFELLAPLDAAEFDELEAALGRPVSRDAAPMLVDVGPRWVVAQLPDAAAVLALKPDFAATARQSARLGATGVTVYGRHADAMQAAIEVRAFAPAHGIDEDPVCGSGTGWPVSSAIMAVTMWARSRSSPS